MEFIRFVQSFHNPLLDSLFTWITMLGEETFFMLFLSLVFWCINKEFGYRMGFAYLINVNVNHTLKNIFKVPRPIGQEGIRSLRVETAPGYSFPSGHTQNAASFFTSFGRYLKKRWLTVLFILFIVFVGLSRIYLGVHTFRDVLVGGLLGAAVVFASDAFFMASQKKGNEWFLLLLLIPLFLVYIFLPSEDIFKVGGTLTALITGHYIEKRYINFDVKAPLPIQVLKYGIGIGVLMALRFLLKMLFPAGMVFDALRYFIMGIWVIILAPLVFSLFGKKNSLFSKA